MSCCRRSISSAGDRALIPVLHPPPTPATPATPLTPLRLLRCSRRYALGPCIFKLCREARAAAAHGLYIDGDLAASELAAFIEACSKSGLPAFELVNFVANREALLKQLGTIDPSVAALDESKQRDFAKRARAKPRLPPPPTSHHPPPTSHLLLPPVPPASCLPLPLPPPTILPSPTSPFYLPAPTSHSPPSSCLLPPTSYTSYLLHPAPLTRARL